MKNSKRYRKYVIPLVILVLITGFLMVRKMRSGKDQLEIQTSVVERGTVMSSVSGTGVLQPLTTVEVKSNVGGQVVDLAVDEGDRVKAGQLIARIDPSDSISNLDQANADYMSARAKVDQARQSLNMQRLQTKSSIISAEQGLESSRQRLSQAEQEAKVQPKLTAESIKQAQNSLDSAIATLNQTKNALIPQKLASVKASYNQAKASFDKAEKNLSRQKSLLAKGFVSASVVDDAEAEYEVANAQLESSKSSLDTVQNECDQDMNNAEAKVSQARSSLESTKANRIQDDIKKKDLMASRAALKQSAASLSSARAASYQNQMKSEDILQAQAQLSKAEAALVNARTQLGYTTVTAPRDGVVVKKYVEKGSIVTAGRQAMAGSGSGVTIVEIADITRMRVVVDVDETDIAKIMLGQEVDVTVDACPDELFAGKVIKIAPKAEINSSVTTVPVTVELDRTDSRLKPEMNASCDFIIDRKNSVLYVPVEAISETDSGMEVAVIEGGKQVTRKIEVGITGDENCEIISGLKEGDTVVIPQDESDSASSRRPRGFGGPGGPPPM